MLAKLNSRFLATTVSVAALTFGLAFGQSTSKASAQVSGEGSTAAAALYTGFGANYAGGGSGVCAGGAVPDGFDFCGTDIPFAPVDGTTLRPVANLRIEAPVNGGDTGLSQDQFCAIIRGDVTTFSDGTPITVVYRLPGSGTGTIVYNTCGADGSQVPGAIGVGSSGAVVSTVASTPGAIGYAEQANVSAVGVPNALANYISGTTYALVSNDNDAANAFIDSIIADPATVNNLGYDPISQ